MPIVRDMAASADTREYDIGMKTFTAVVERDADTGLYVGWVPWIWGPKGADRCFAQSTLYDVVSMTTSHGL